MPNIREDQIMLQSAFIFLIFVLNAKAQIPFYGDCPEVQVVQDFDVNRYLGKWFEYEKYFAIFEAGGKCISATYGSFPNATDRISVVNRQIYKIVGSKSQVEGYAVFENPENSEAKLLVTFTSIPVSNKGKYWVLGTDYDNYAVVWSCSELTIFNTQFAWILTRERKPSEEVIRKAHEVIEENKINQYFLMQTDQNDCPDDE